MAELAQRRKPVKREWWLTPWLFLAPGLAVVLLFSVYPFLNTVLLSFTDATALGGGQFTGVDNFVRMLDDPQFWTAITNSSLYVVGVVPALVVLPLLLALLVRKQVPGITFFRSAFYTPVVASIVVVGLIWTWLLDSRGLVNSLLQGLQIVSEPIPFLTDETLLLISAMVVTVWKGLGYYMIIYLAALANVPKELHEAAEVDGAGPIRRFFSITVPTIRSTMVLVAALSAVAAFRVFAEIFILSGNSGGPGGADITLVMLMRQTATGLNGDLGYASALSLVLFVLTLGLMLLVLRLNRKEDEA
ncbi:MULTISPECIES: carbohydrate ABC transporter permease [unclassified Crossiella]|uniref:carbohydrate ABC transporter permease n=1 Tax=unclassified Crossiella TaxID=2620835 RepID=UPI001FFF8FA9|nr:MULTISPECIES: sugar ABC transporter permease [unclassified Crossiella]MCK2236997.1 sugar ABC transporter permease [Crossiella sp. S99.2]MCK2250665.1 sugar ABC transporter permease [Crossiella sp. S99.1]